jgi:hypothetical protein
MRSRAATSRPSGASALVSAQATLELDGAPLLVGPPALLDRQGEAAGLLAVLV